MNIPQEAIEKAARAMVATNPDHASWDDLTDAESEWYLRDANAALEAGFPMLVTHVLSTQANARGQEDARVREFFNALNPGFIACDVGLSDRVREQYRAAREFFKKEDQ